MSPYLEKFITRSHALQERRLPILCLSTGAEHFVLRSQNFQGQSISEQLCSIYNTKVTNCANKRENGKDYKPVFDTDSSDYYSY